MTTEWTTVTEDERALVAAAVLRRWVDRTHDGRPTRSELRALVEILLDERARRAVDLDEQAPAPKRAYRTCEHGVTVLVEARAPGGGDG